jgi:hypothetical protein
VSDQEHADERRLLRTAKSCGPDAPTLASSSRMFYRPNRAVMKRYPLMTVAKEPGHRGERDISRKTIACGNAGRSGVLVVTRVRSTNTKCTRGRGCSGHPAFPTPLLGARDKCKPRAHRAARFMRMSRGRHCERSEAIYTFFAARWIASSLTLLAMTLTTRIHPSCPDLIRASITLREKFFEQDGSPGHPARRRAEPVIGPRFARTRWRFSPVMTISWRRRNTSLACSLCIRAPASLRCAPRQLPNDIR